MPIPSQMEIPQSLRSSSLPDPLGFRFTIELATSTLCSAFPFNFKGVVANLRDTAYNYPVPFVAVPPFSEDGGVPFHISIVRASHRSATDIGIDHESSNSVRIDAPRNISEDLVESFQFCGARSIRNHTPIFPQDTEIEALVNGRNDDERGLACRRRQLLEIACHTHWNMQRYMRRAWQDELHARPASTSHPQKHERSRITKPIETGNESSGIYDNGRKRFFHAWFANTSAQIEVTQQSYATLLRRRP